MAQPALAAEAADNDAVISVVTGNNVYVRSGPADSYYPIGHVQEGQMVKVIGERFNWARIRTTGPLFEDDTFFGYIIYPQTQRGRFRLAEDGRSGVTLGRTDVLAPNLNTDFNPNDSWKPLVRLEADQEVIVLETTQTANNLVHKVRLPESAEVWVSARYIRPADSDERREWDRLVYGEPEEEKEEKEAERVAEADSDDKDATDEQTREAQADADREDERRAEEQPTERAERSKDDESEGERRADRPADQETPSEPQDVAQTDRDDESERAPVVAREAEEVPEVVDPPAAEEDETEEVDDAEADEADEEAAPAEEDVSERVARATLDDLEAAFNRLREEDIETREVRPLRRMYLQFAEQTDDETPRRFAEGRAEQLQLMIDIQQRRQELREIQQRSERASGRAASARVALDDHADYTAVGRLTTSRIYDGDRLPRLLRLQDPGTGRTVAYVQASEEDDLTVMIGQLIGIVGERVYDGGLRLNLLTPRRIDVLAPQQ
ncbi:MAG: hypothetical protein EA377_11760 [Phycisphaerales bacterium]|nr:MAG: hypothetical protein EA377_11760 [Phycisphaerales bacterium]